MKKQKANLIIYPTQHGNYKWLFINVMGTPFVHSPDVKDDEAKSVAEAACARLEGYSSAYECEKSFYRFCSLIGIPNPESLVEVKHQHVNELLLACR
jgi:hypothetical protein